eukprot:Rmarinus@m.24785
MPEVSKRTSKYSKLRQATTTKDGHRLCTTLHHIQGVIRHSALPHVRYPTIDGRIKGSHLSNATQANSFSTTDAFTLSEYDLSKRRDPRPITSGHLSNKRDVMGCSEDYGLTDEHAGADQTNALSNYYKNSRPTSAPVNRSCDVVTTKSHSMPPMVEGAERQTYCRPNEGEVLSPETPEAWVSQYTDQPPTLRHDRSGVVSARSSTSHALSARPGARGTAPPCRRPATAGPSMSGDRNCSSPSSSKPVSPHATKPLSGSHARGRSHSEGPRTPSRQKWARPLSPSRSTVTGAWVGSPQRDEDLSLQPTRVETPKDKMETTTETPKAGLVLEEQGSPEAIAPLGGLRRLELLETVKAVDAEKLPAGVRPSSPPPWDRPHDIPISIPKPIALQNTGWRVDGRMRHYDSKYDPKVHMVRMRRPLSAPSPWSHAERFGGVHVTCPCHKSTKPTVPEVEHESDANRSSLRSGIRNTHDLWLEGLSLELHAEKSGYLNRVMSAGEEKVDPSMSMEWRGWGGLMKRQEVRDLWLQFVANEECDGLTLWGSSFKLPSTRIFVVSSFVRSGRIKLLYNFEIYIQYFVRP